MMRTIKKFVQHPQMLSIGAIFALNSVLFAFWITRLPQIKVALALSEGTLGLALFFMPLGGLTAMSVTHKVIKRWGEGRVSTVGIVIHALGMFTPMLAGDFYQFIAALFLVGFVGGIVGVAMNAVVATIEKETKTIFMSACHGCWSLGGMLGATLGSVIIGLGVSKIWQMSGMFVLILLLTIFYVGKHLWNIRNSQPDITKRKKFSLPPPALMGLAFVGLCTMVGEGAIADWSAIYLAEVAHAPDFISGLGYAAFALSMTAGRFVGDNLTMRFGALKIIQIGSLIAMLGMGLVFLAIPATAIAGFALMGIGYSCIVPVIFSSSANISGIPPAQALASISSTAYIGFLVGPVAIGFIAEELSLSISFLLIVLLQLLSLITAKKAMELSRA